jgi:hypothetical protein
MPLLTFVHKSTIDRNADPSNSEDKRSKFSGMKMFNWTSSSRRCKRSLPVNIPTVTACVSESQPTSTLFRLRDRCSSIKTEARKTFKAAKEGWQNKFRDQHHRSSASRYQGQQHQPYAPLLPVLLNQDEESMLEEVLDAGRSITYEKHKQSFLPPATSADFRIPNSVTNVSTRAGTQFEPTLVNEVEDKPITATDIQDQIENSGKGENTSIISEGAAEEADISAVDEGDVASSDDAEDMPDEDLSLGDLGGDQLPEKGDEEEWEEAESLDSDRLPINKDGGGDADGDDDEDEHEDEDDDEDEHEEEEEDPLETFHSVMAAVNLQHLAQIALLVRTCLVHEDLKLSNLPKFKCEVADTPMSGAYNLVYTVSFSDGVKWVARIPGHGTSTRFGSLDAQRMNSEYYTMQYIGQHTTMPLPQVHHWETTCDSIGTPFALMDYVEGQPLDDLWDDDLSESQRLACLSELAGYMSQLSKLRFSGLGPLKFDQSGQFEKIGDHIHIIEENGLPWGRTETSSSQKTFIESVWDCYDPEDDDVKGDFLQRAALAILRLALLSIPDYLTSETQLALRFPDLNSQNILVDADGKITALIDWDMVSAEGAVSGWARYPMWLTEDWNPDMLALYCPDVQDKGGVSRDVYRRHYFNEMVKYASVDSAYHPGMTKVSHVMEAILGGLQMPDFRSGIVNKLLDHAFNGSPPFLLADYAIDFEAGNTEHQDQVIQSAFNNMWHAEWEVAGATDESSHSIDGAESITSSADDSSESSSTMSTRSSAPGSPTSEPLTPESDTFGTTLSSNDGCGAAEESLEDLPKDILVDDVQSPPDTLVDDATQPSTVDVGSDH